MDKKFVVLGAALMCAAFICSLCDAAPLFVATAKNLRGAMYQGIGPTPMHATEMAMVKCSQDSFIPGSCKVLGVRMDCPLPAPCAAPMPQPVKKVRAYHPYPPTAPYGRPVMP